MHVSERPLLVRSCALRYIPGASLVIPLVNTFIFPDNHTQIRVVRRSQFGEPLFVARDVLVAIGCPGDVGAAPFIGTVPAKWKCSVPVVTPGGYRNMAVITEQGLSFFLTNTRKQGAPAFHKWISRVVLPAISNISVNAPYDQTQANPFAVPVASTAFIRPPLENTSMNNIRDTHMTRTIIVAELPVITHQNVRVITTELLAKLYGTEDVNLRVNYLNNQERFVAGKHFFKLEGEDLRRFKEFHRVNPAYSVEISPRVNALTLWTERGAARHAKILDTDAAWEVFEQLEDAYFNPRENKQPALPNFNNPVEAARAWADAPPYMKTRNAIVNSHRSQAQSTPCCAHLENTSMNNMISPALTNDATATMTSLEISKLVESRHDNVKASIKRLANQGVIEFPAMQEISTATKPTKVYVFSGEQGKPDIQIGCG